MYRFSTLYLDLIQKLHDMIEIIKTNVYNNLLKLDFRTGSLLATTCKDKKLRIIDPRSGEVLRVGDSHQGNKASKVSTAGP